MINIVISLDFELGWGVLETDQWKKRESKGVYDGLRPVWTSLLNDLDVYSIPLTIAITTSMLKAKVSEIDLSHLPESYARSVHDFLRHARFSTWNALDLFEILVSKQTSHDIGTHSHTHIYGAHPSCNDKVLHDDICKSVKTLRENGVSAHALIFPRDQVLRLSAATPGITTYRIPPVHGGVRCSHLDSLQRLVRPAPASHIAILPEGLVTQSGSFFLNWTTGRYRRLKKLSIHRKLESLLSKSTESATYHLWLHPFNLVETPGFLDYFRSWLRRSATKRDRHFLRFSTMTQEAELLLRERSNGG